MHQQKMGKWISFSNTQKMQASGMFLKKTVMLIPLKEQACFSALYDDCKGKMPAENMD